ncbi:HXXEE domain-containing protein [Larkinella knui]
MLFWSFPFLFMIHDFEEILFVKAWITRNRDVIKQRIPKLADRLLPHFDRLSTQGFALAVAEEFLLVSLTTLLSLVTNQFHLWYSLFLAFTVHLLMHIGQGLFFRRYVPGMVTSLLFLPVCLYILYLGFNRMSFTLPIAGVYLLAGFLLLAVNLLLIHKMAASFSDWLNRFEKGK